MRHRLRSSHLPPLALAGGTQPPDPLPDFFRSPRFKKIFHDEASFRHPFATILIQKFRTAYPLCPLWQKASRPLVPCKFLATHSCVFPKSGRARLAATFLITYAASMVPRHSNERRGPALLPCLAIPERSSSDKH